MHGGSEGSSERLLKRFIAEMRSNVANHEPGLSLSGKTWPYVDARESWKLRRATASSRSIEAWF